MARPEGQQCGSSSLKMPSSTMTAPGLTRKSRTSVANIPEPRWVPLMIPRSSGLVAGGRPLRTASSLYRAAPSGSGLQRIRRTASSVPSPSMSANWAGDGLHDPRPSAQRP